VFKNLPAFALLFLSEIWWALRPAAPHSHEGGCLFRYAALPESGQLARPCGLSAGSQLRNG
jgi:hypothetical protein